MYPKNAASPERIAVGPVVQISDGAVQTSGVTVSVMGQGGAEGGGGGTVAYSTGGIVLYTPIQAETNFTSFLVTAYKTGCIPASVTIITTASVTPGTVILGASHPAQTFASLAITGALSVGTTTTLTGAVATGAVTKASEAITGALTVGDGVAITCSTAGKSAVKATGNGAGHGLELIGGATNGNGMIATGGATNSNGIALQGTGTGNGLLATGGAGAAGDGVEAVAGGGVPIRGDHTGNVTGNLSGTIGNLATAAKTDVENAVWDAAIDVGTLHAGAGTTGAKLFAGDGILVGTCQAGSTYNNIILAASGPSATDDIYKGCLAVIISGTGIGQARLIAKYVGSTKVATVDVPWITAPTNTSIYKIYPFSQILLADTGVATASGASTITLGASAPAIADFYVGHTIYLSGGTGIGQARIITAYTNTRIATVSPAWSGGYVPDTTTVYKVLPLGQVVVNSMGSTVDFSTTQKSSITTACTASTPMAAAVSGAVGSIGAGGISNASFNADVGATAYATNIIALAVEKSIEQNNLDHLIKVAKDTNWATTVTKESVIDLMTSKDISQTFARATDSLEGVADAVADPWNVDLPGAYVAGKAGYIVGTNLDAVVSTRTKPADTQAAVTLVATCTTLTNKTGFSLASTGLDVVAAPADLANDTAARATFVGMIRAIFNRFYNKVTQTATEQIVNSDAGAAVSTMVVSDDSVTQTKNKSS
jgi:hypothetical protein